MAAPGGNRLVLDLKQQGIPAVVIGKATADNDRVVINEDERRFLEPLRAGVQGIRYGVQDIEPSNAGILQNQWL